MREEGKIGESAVTGSADEKEEIVDSSSTATENQSNAPSKKAAVVDGTTPVAPSQGIRHPTGAAPEDSDNPHNGRNSQGNANTVRPSIQPPNNREKIPENRESGTVGYGRPPVEHQFQPGRSGNPGGRPRTLVISERYLEMSETRLPNNVRLQIEGKLKIKLPRRATFADALCQLTWMSALGCCEVGRGLLMMVKEIRESIEGKARPRNWVLQPPVQRDPDELRKHIFGKLVETAYKRSKLYNMEMPELDQMAKDAGVNLEEAMGDVKPDSPEEGIGDKES